MKKILITALVFVALFTIVGVSRAQAQTCDLCHVVPGLSWVTSSTPSTPAANPCCTPVTPTPANPCCTPQPPIYIPQPPIYIPVPTPTPPTPVYNNCYINSFTTSNSSVNSGSPATLYWTTNGYCTSASISGYGSVNVSGSVVVYPTSTTSYVLRAYGNNNNDSSTVYITVNNQNSNVYPSVSTYNPTYIGTRSATLSGYASISGAYMNAWLEFPCYGSSYGVQYNTTSTNLLSGVNNLSPNTTYSYCAVGQNTSGGQVVRGSIVSFRTLAEAVVAENTTYVKTNPATGVTRTSGTMNGTISNPSGLNQSAYFEYGTTTSLGSRTSSKFLGTASSYNFNESLYGLPSGSIHYYRAVSENSSGTQRGLIEVFGAPEETVKQVVVTRNTTQTVNVAKRYKTIYVPTVVEDNSPIEPPVEYIPNNNQTASAFWGAQWLQYGPYFWLLIIIIILLIILLARTYRDNKNTKTTTVVTHDNNIH